MHYAASIMQQVRWMPPNKKHLHYDELYKRLLPMLLEQPCVEKRDVIEKYLDELCPHWHWECDEIQRDRILWTRLWLAEANAVVIHGNMRKLVRMRRWSMALDLANAARLVSEASVDKFNTSASVDKFNTSASVDKLKTSASVDKLKTSARGGKLKLAVASVCKFKTLVGGSKLKLAVAS
jgi:hypothetical protein